jgi:ABC-type multidrug transport system permease subunit
MDASQQFARSSLEAGQPPQYVVQTLMNSGWPSDAAWQLVRSAQPPKRRDPRLWMVIVSFALWIATTLPLWLISATLIVIHSVLSRREPRPAHRQGRTLGVLSWILAIGNPIRAVVTAVVAVVVFGAMGIMCGEAVSESCGM